MQSKQDFSSPYHQIRFTQEPSRAIVWRAICRYLQKFILETQASLELGAGYGEFSRFIRVKEKWALDVNPELISYWPEDVHPVIQSALSPLPFGPNSFGTIVASNFFEHFLIGECQTILDEVRRILIPGGRLVIIQPNFRLEPGRYYDDYTHKTPFTDVGFADFLRSLGWRVKHQEARFLPFSMKSRLPKWEWLVDLYLFLPYRPAAGQFLVVAEAN